MENTDLIALLAKALAPRLAPFKTLAENDGLMREGKEAELTACAFLITETVRPCCCALCNKKILEQLLGESGLCPVGSATAKKLAELIYDDLCRLDGLG